MEEVKIQTDFIKLGQFLKFADIISSGGEEKHFLLNNDVLVNGEKEDRRGKKLRHGDLIDINGQLFKIVQDGEKS